MRVAWLLAVAVTVLSVDGRAQFFPKSSLDFKGNNSKAEWYSHQLQALEEPSLFALAKNGKAESYRFLWLRTFHHPIAVRVDHSRADGSWVLITKIANGAGGYGPGKVTTNISRNLTAQEAKSFVSTVESSGFWNAPNPVQDQAGTDGSQWIIEGVKARHYHVLDRWMPKNGPAHDLGLFLALDLAKLSIPRAELY